jgi:hypothetical protein
MTARVAQQTSSKLSIMNYPRKLFRAATYDALLPVVTSRKRLLSEQNECRNFMMKFSNDDILANKRRKIGNYFR